MRRYLLASLRDVDAADDLAQEFALKFLRGDFKNADPCRGRFRDFVKRAVYNLMMDYHRSRQARRALLGNLLSEPAVRDPELGDHDSRFLESWRRELMAKAWAALERVQARTNQPFAEVLRLRTQQPDVRSPALAEQLSARLGRPVNSGWVRLNLHRARDLFVEALVREVEQSLEQPSSERLEEELEELGLLERCRGALRRGRPRE